MSEATSGQRKWLRRAGLILGLLIGGLGLLVGVMVGEYMAGSIRYLALGEWLILLAPGLVVIGSVAIAWRWELIGGVMLLVEGLVLTVWAIALHATIFTFIVGLLFLGTGILFLLSWTYRRSPSNKISSPSQGEGDKGDGVTQ